MSAWILSVCFAGTIVVFHLAHDSESLESHARRSEMLDPGILDSELGMCDGSESNE
jgi:hypothetical protein